MMLVCPDCFEEFCSEGHIGTVLDTVMARCPACGWMFRVKALEASE